MKWNTLYHGTSSAAWDAIQHQGLIAGEGIGGDEWARQNPWEFGFMYPEPTPSVYLTPDAERAAFYARLASEVTESAPVILMVAIPSDTRLVRDFRDSAGYKCVACHIPPENIKPMEA